MLSQTVAEQGDAAAGRDAVLRADHGHGAVDARRRVLRHSASGRWEDHLRDSGRCTGWQLRTGPLSCSVLVVERRRPAVQRPITQVVA